MTAVIHVASIALNTLLPFHVVELGGTRTQVGLLFSVMTIVSMVLRPIVGGWVDRVGVRPVIVPGIAALAVTSVALQIAGSPSALIVMMMGVGLANGLVSTSAAVLTARSSAAEHRGEALGTYYLATALSLAVAPPLALGLRAIGGMRLAFGVVTALSLVMFALVPRLPATTDGLGSTGAGLRLFSRSALPASFAMVLATIGHSSVFAFLPLYAVSRGQGAALAWFFVVYPAWMIGCRLVLRGVSDRFGHLRVALFAMSLVALSYLIIALPPTPASLVVAAVVLASGSALHYPTLAAYVVARAPEHERGLALGTLSGSWDLGVVVGSILIGAVADWLGYSAGFVVGALSGALGVAVLALSAPQAPTALPSSQPAAGAEV
jgi:MFS family permease